jgi:hypothetical protein
VVASTRVYCTLLRLYPAGHRRDFGSLMAQLFRDQCRDAYRAKRLLGVAKVWLRVLPDVAKTSFNEQSTELERRFRMEKMGFRKASMAFLATGIGLALVSFLFANAPAAGAAVASLSALAVLGRAIAEIYRPSVEWLKGWVGALIVLVAFGFFMPAWAKLHYPPAQLKGVLEVFFGGSVMLNGVVALAKTGQFLFGRLRG